MKASMKTCLFGTGLLVLCAGMLVAQEAGRRNSGRGQGQDSNIRGDNARGTNAVRAVEDQGTNARNAEGMRGGQESRVLVGHAVSMAIGSVTLKGQAEQAGQSGAQGSQSGAQGGQSQAGQSQPGAQGGQSQAGTGQDPAQQLLMHARKGMQESRRLLQGAGRDQGSAQQLFTAANGYIDTLFALCGESSSGRDAGSTRTGEASDNAGRAQTGRSSRDEDLGAGRAAPGQGPQRQR